MEGGLVKDGDTNILEATINGNTGVQGSIGVSCEVFEIVGTWNGITVSAIWDVFDGFIHTEAGLVLVQPRELPVLKLPIPGI